MAVLTNKSIASTYKSVLSIGATTESALTSSIQQLTDGLGNGSPLSMSTTQIQFNTGANTFKFPTTRGASGKILKLADGNGTLAWADDSVASTLNFSGSTTGTGSIALNTQTLAFTGTANQITATAGSQAITFAFPAAGVTLPNGSIATTQSASDNSTKVATTAYVEAAVAAGGTGDVTKSGTITQNQIAIWNDGTDELRSEPAISIDADHSISFDQRNSANADKKTNNFGGGNVANVTGVNNVGFGASNLAAVVAGQANVAIGNSPMFTLTSGSNNVAVGNSALYDCNPSNSTAIGAGALNKATGDGNTAVGSGAGNKSTYAGTLGTFIGKDSGSEITTGSKNVIIGSNTGSVIAALSNHILISDGDGNVRLKVDNNGKVGIGTATATVIAVGRLNVKSASTAVAHGMNVWNSSDETKYTYVTHNGTKGCIGTSYISGGYSDLSLQTSEADRLNISTAGVSTFTNGTSYELLELKTSRTDANYGIKLYHSDSTLYGYLGGTGSSVLTGASVGELVIRAEVSNLVFSTANSRRMTISSSTGNILIGGTTDGGYKLNVTGGEVRFQAGAVVTGQMYSTSVKVNDLGSGDVFSTGAGILTNTDPSDSRLKTNIENIDYGLSEILKLRSVKFNWLDGDKNSKKQFGFIAQEVKEIIPESVSEFDYDGDQRFGLEKNAIYVGLVKAIQEQQTIIEDLKSRIEKLEL